MERQGPRYGIGYAQLPNWYDVKAFLALLDGGVGAYAVLDKDGKDPRNEKNMDNALRMVVRNQGLVVHAQLSNGNGTHKRRSTSQAESPAAKRPRSQPPSNVANAAHHYSQPHSQQVTAADDSAERLKTSYQCADYALQFMSNGGLRHHSFGGLLCDDHLQIMYYDHSVIAVAAPLDIRHDQRMFILYLVCLHKLSLCDRSGIPNARILQNPQPYLTEYSDYEKVEQDWYNILSGQVLLLEDRTGQFQVTLGRIIDRQTGLIGRCTYIVNATCARWAGIELIVKITWSPTSRTSEAEFMESVHQAVSQTGAYWVLDHVPSILHSQDFPHLPDEVGGRLAAFLNNLDEDRWASEPGDFKYEERVMRVSVHEKLYKLSELDTVSNHAQVFLDVVQVHRWLYNFPHILHRDISHGNIMWHRRRGRICGVLNDFDLSSFRDSMAPSSKQRTGTRPYMARELHQEERSTRHLYRHDLESLFYVLLLLTGAHVLLDEPIVDSITKEKCYLLGDENSPYGEWFSLKEDSVLKKKDTLVKSELQPYTHPSFQVLNGRIWDARVSLFEGFAAQQVHVARLARAQVPRATVASTQNGFWGIPSTRQSAAPIPAFDNETLGDKWTYTGFLDCIGGGLPFERMYPVPRP